MTPLMQGFLIVCVCVCVSTEVVLYIYMGRYSRPYLEFHWTKERGQLMVDDSYVRIYMRNVSFEFSKRVCA